MVHIPGYNYCGLLNNPGALPVNELDAACMEHDQSSYYDSYRGYFQWNPDDEKLLRKARRRTGLAARSVESFFKGKKRINAMLKSNTTRKRWRDPYSNPARFAGRYKRESDTRHTRFKQTKRDRDLQSITYAAKEFARLALSAARSPYRGRFRGVSLANKTRLGMAFRSFRNNRAMPKRYRSNYRRRPFFKRRRRYGRYRNKRRFRYVPRTSLLKQLMPPRSIIHEQDFGVDLPEGQTTYYAPTVIFGTTELEAQWKEIGDGSNLIISATPSPTYRARLARSSFRIEVTNTNLFPMYVKMYWLVAKRFSFTSSLLNQKAVAWMAEGWADRMLDADETNYTVTNDVVNSAVHGLYPTDSQTLRRHFKIISGKAVTILPGFKADWRWRTRGGKVFSYEDIMDDDTYKSVPGYTVVPLLRFQMPIGHDTTVLTEQSRLSGTANMVCFKRTTWQYVGGHKSLLALANLADATFTNGGEGPADNTFNLDE